MPLQKIIRNEMETEFFRIEHTMSIQRIMEILGIFLSSLGW